MRLVRDNTTIKPGTTWGYVVWNIEMQPDSPGAIFPVRRENLAYRHFDSFFVMAPLGRRNYVVFYNDAELGLVPKTPADGDATNNLQSLPTVLVNESARCQ